MWKLVVCGKSVTPSLVSYCLYPTVQMDTMDKIGQFLPFLDLLLGAALPFLPAFGVAQPASAPRDEPLVTPLCCGNAPEGLSLSSPVKSQNV